MNPKTISAQALRVEREVRRIRGAWPEAKVRFTRDFLTAVAVIREPTSTYIIEVEPTDDGVATRYLWVSHRVPIGPDSTHIPQWTEGWVD